MGLHSHHHHQHHKSEAGTRNVATAFFINVIFTLIEIVGGFYTNSIAILSDALHDLGDSLALGMAWYFEKLSTKKANHNYTYGYGRFTVLGAMINGIILITGSVLIIYHAIPRLISPQEVQAPGMFILAVLGITFNGLAVLRLNKNGSLNERVVYYHLLEDVLGWVVVLVSSVVIYFWGIYRLDALLSIFIAFYILYNAAKNVFESFALILQKTPDHIDLDQIKSILEEIEYVADVHDLHVWSMDGDYIVMSLHARLTTSDLPLEELKNIKAEILERLAHLDIDHATVEFESPDEVDVLTHSTL